MNSRNAMRTLIKAVLFMTFVYALYIFCRGSTVTNGIPSRSIIHTSAMVSFILAGPKSDYKMHNIPKWIAATTGRIQIFRGDDPVFEIVSPNDRETMRILLKSHVHVVVADFMKFIAHYYCSGFVTVKLNSNKDFDTYPVADIRGRGWPHLSSCDVVLGVEHSCFEGSCIKNYSRYAQIETWTTYSSRPRLIFYRKYLDYIHSNLIANPGKTSKQMDVQNVAGSGILTDFVRLYIQTDYLDLLDKDKIKFRNDQGAYRLLVVANENICIVGHIMQSKLIGHDFEGTWKSD